MCDDDFPSYIVHLLHSASFTFCINVSLQDTHLDPHWAQEPQAIRSILWVAKLLWCSSLFTSNLAVSFCCKSLLERLFSKHFSQGRKKHLLFILTDATKLFDQSFFIYCAELIQNDLPLFALKPAADTRGILRCISFGEITTQGRGF